MEGIKLERNVFDDITAEELLKRFEEKGITRIRSLRLIRIYGYMWENMKQVEMARRENLSTVQICHDVKEVYDTIGGDLQIIMLQREVLGTLIDLLRGAGLKESSLVDLAKTMIRAFSTKTLRVDARHQVSGKLTIVKPDIVNVPLDQLKILEEQATLESKKRAESLLPSDDESQ